LQRWILQDQGGPRSTWASGVCECRAVVMACRRRVTADAPSLCLSSRRPRYCVDEQLAVQTVSIHQQISLVLPFCHLADAIFTALCLYYPFSGTYTIHALIRPQSPLACRVCALFIPLFLDPVTAAPPVNRVRKVPSYGLCEEFEIR